MPVRRAVPEESPRIALLAGATGLVGHALLPLLIASPRYAHVHVLLRRPSPSLATHPKLSLHLVNFRRLEGSCPPADDVFIALGTTRKTAGSRAAFRQVDFDAVVSTASAAHDAGATRLAVVSAMGANAKSRVFYNRVKGQMQQAVIELGYGTIVIAQPSLLIGDRSALGQPLRAGEEWGRRLLQPVRALLPHNIRPIDAGTVAQAMLKGVLDGRLGVRIVRGADMQNMQNLQVMKDVKA